jgi:hypothetical protein
MARRDGLKLVYQIQLISTQYSRQARQDRMRLDTAVKCKDRTHDGISVIVKVTGTLPGAASALRLIGAPTRPSPWLRTLQYQTKTAASSLAANELAFIGLFGGQPMRNRGPRSSTQPNGPLYPEHSLWSSPHRVRAGVPT